MVQKEQFYTLHAELCKAIFNPKRLAIIDALRDGRMNVGDLSQSLNTSQSNISQHLGILRSKGLVTASMEGNCTYYRISNDKIFKAFDMVSEIVREKFKNDNEMYSQIMK